MHYGPTQPRPTAGMSPNTYQKIYDHWLEGQAGRARISSAWGKGHGYDPTGGAFTTGLMGVADPYGPPTPMSVPSPQGSISTTSASPYEGPTDIYGAPRPEDWGAAPAPGLGGLLSPAQGPMTQESLPKMGEWDGGPMEPGEVVSQPTGGLLAGGSYVAPSAGVFGGFTPDAQTMAPVRSGEDHHVAPSDPEEDFENWLQGRRQSGMGAGTYMGEMGLIRDSIYAPRRGFETAGLLAGSAHGGAPGSTGWNGGQLVVG